MKGYPLDGHINRELIGKTITNVTKDGRFLWVEMTTGERFCIAWATPNGVGIEGEPCLVKADVKVSVAPVSFSGIASTV